MILVCIKTPSGIEYDSLTPGTRYETEDPSSLTYKVYVKCGDGITRSFYYCDNFFETIDKYRTRVINTILE